MDESATVDEGGRATTAATTAATGLGSSTWTYDSVRACELSEEPPFEDLLVPLWRNDDQDIQLIRFDWFSFPSVRLETKLHPEEPANDPRLSWRERPLSRDPAQAALRRVSLRFSRVKVAEKVRRFALCGWLGQGCTDEVTMRET